MRERKTSPARGACTTRLLVRSADESGIALVMALGIMLVLTIMVTTVVVFTASGARDSQRVNGGQKAYALAEAGISNALAVLNANYPDTANGYPGPRCVLNPQTPPANFPGAEPTYPACAASTPFTSIPDASRPGETVLWWGRLRRVSGMGIAWVVQSTGSVPNPTGPGSAPVTRTLQAKIPVVVGPNEDPAPGILNLLYSVTNATALQAVTIRTPLYTRGNLSLGNGVDIYAPIYVTCVEPPAPVPTTGSPCPSTAGNVLMENTAKIYQGATVAIGGRLDQTSPQNTVGTSGARISEAHIVNGCSSKTRAYNAACKWDLHSVFANAASRDFVMPADPVQTPPAIDWNLQYQTGSPGPTWGCDTGTVPMLESAGSTALDNSVPAVFNLVGASYSCKTLNGELTFDATTRTLTIAGTIYVDGSAEAVITGPQAVLYQGQGAIYLSGSFLLENTNLCAVVAANGKDCNLASGAWDPNANALIIVAKSKGTDPGAQATTGNNSVEVKSSQFQGVLSGQHDLLSETTSVVQGPMISFQGGLNLSQTSGASFPDVQFAPYGAPGSPPPPTVLLAPRDFSGG